MVIGSVLLLLMALLMDRAWGEPRAALHPVVWIGKYLQVCGGIATACRPAMAFLLGAFFWWLGVVGVFALTWGLQTLVFHWLLRGRGVPQMFDRPDPFFIAGLVLFAVFAWLLKTTFSWRMLRDETVAVEGALQQSLDAGRSRLAMLVSRDATQLSASEVRESAIESLAENLNDSVVAPIFWFVLFGLPGAAVYRFANTADAMWGYRGFRQGVQWEWAGKWAAHADDVLSWVPARITALLLLLAAWDFAAFSRLAAEARKTPSPNSGWPMAAMALALDVCLRKPEVYTLNSSGRPPLAVDAGLAIGLASRVMAMIVWSVVALAVLKIVMVVFQ